MNSDQYSWSNVSLSVEFLSGDHRLTSPVTIYNISSLTMYSRNKNASIIFYHFAYFELINITFAQLINLTFLGRGLGDSYALYQPHSALEILSTNTSVKECKFHNTQARVIYARYCDITIHKSEFVNSSKDMILTTALDILFSNLSIKECIFLKSNGAVVTGQYCNITVYKSVFINSLDSIHYTGNLICPILVVFIMKITKELWIPILLC